MATSGQRRAAAKNIFIAELSSTLVLLWLSSLLHVRLPKPNKHVGACEANKSLVLINSWVKEVQT